MQFADIIPTPTAATYNYDASRFVQPPNEWSLSPESIHNLTINQVGRSLNFTVTQRDSRFENFEFSSSR